MSKARVADPQNRFEFVVGILEQVDRLGITDDRLAPLRAVLAEANDDAETEETADLLVSSDAAREGIRRRLSDGTLDLEQARAELVALHARVAADAELAKMISTVGSERRGAVWATAGRIDWEAVLVPHGQEAADRVNELARMLPADTSDQAVAGFDKPTRQRWELFHDGLARYRQVVSLLLDLRWNRVLGIAPLEAEEFEFLVDRAEWYYAGPYGALATERNTTIVEAIHHGAVVGVPLPVDIERRMEARADLRDASEGVARQGWPIPGVDVPVDHYLPANIRAQLPQLVKRPAA